MDTSINLLACQQQDKCDAVGDAVARRTVVCFNNQKGCWVYWESSAAGAVLLVGCRRKDGKGRVTTVAGQKDKE